MHLFVAKGLPSVLKDPVKVELAPADVGLEAGELPDAVDLLVPVKVCRVGVALHGDLLHGGVLVPLVRDAQLVVADDLVLGHLLPARAADEVLRAEGGVAQHLLARDHADELLGRHCLPELVEEGAVVNLFFFFFLVVAVKVWIWCGKVKINMAGRNIRAE